jgi:hypothetical protein
MKAILSAYSLILNYETVIDIKPVKILSDSYYRERNLWQGFPDPIFIELWIKSITEITPMNMEIIYKYLQTKTLVIEEKDFEVVYRH